MRNLRTRNSLLSGAAKKRKRQRTGMTSTENKIAALINDSWSLAVQANTFYAARVNKEERT